MFNQNCETTLVSQLLDSIDGHLKDVRSPMEQQQQQQSPEYEMSVDNTDDDELWLSGHRSIFSSYGSHYHKAAPQLRDSQYEGFHWDLYEDRNYHHLAFEQDQHDVPPTCQTASLTEWSMRLSSGVIGGDADTEDDADVEGDDTTSSSDPPRTSWHAIKSKSVHRSCSLSSANMSDGGDQRSRSPLTLYRLFQRARSQQHPCRLYQNFSDKSMCDSLTSSLSCSNINKLHDSMKQEHKVPMPRFQLTSPTTFSQIRINKSNSHNDFFSSSMEQSTTKTKEQSKGRNQIAPTRRSVDQCLQTSIHVDNTSPPPSRQSQPTRRYIPRSASRPLNTDNHCLQTDNLSVTRSKSADRLLNNDNQTTTTTNSNKSSQPSKFPSSISQPSLNTISSLPDLSFLMYYAKENPAPPSVPKLTPSTTQKQSYPIGMKSTLSEPSSLTKKSTRTVFYCSIKVPPPSSFPSRPTTLYPPVTSVQRPRTLKEIKRIKNTKTSPTLISHSPLRAFPLSPSVPSTVSNHIKEEETATFSSTCSSTSTSANSTSSSGYFSNSSANHPRHIQTPTSSHPLKSCLKRAKTEDLTTTPLTIAPTTSSATTPATADVLAVGAAGDIFTLAARTLAARLGDNNMETPRHRRYSAPTISSHQQNFSIQLRIRQKGCTLSEHDLRAKKSVSFCDDIARRLITPSASPKHRPTPPPRSSHRYDRDYCDLVPRESLTDSPPNEFNLSEDEQEHDNEPQLTNFTKNAPSEITKPLPVKFGSDKYLIDAFANVILHIMEIKCSDPQSLHLNNMSNRELDRTLRQDLCPILREVLEDGLRQYSGSLFSKKMNLWRLIDMTTPTTGRFHEAKTKAQLGLPSSADWSEKFNAFIYHLLNLHELASWLTHFVSHRSIFTAYYESWAFILVYGDNDLFERITNQLEKLSPLSFRLKYIHSSNVIPSIRTTTIPSSTTSTANTSNQRPSSLLPKRFNVRSWLRDRKTQVKISPKEPQASVPQTSSSSSSSSVSKSPSSSNIPVPRSISSNPTNKLSSTVSHGSQPNASIRRKLGSIPVPKRHQTVH